MSEDKDKIEFWAQQAAMWHDKYKSVMQIEADYYRYQTALKRIADADNVVTKERLRLIVKRALEES